MAELTDNRVRPQIDAGTIWLTGFIMFVLRMPSLNALENQFRASKIWRGSKQGKMPSADTIGRGFSCASLEPLRRMVRAVNKNAWRNKAIRQRVDQSHRVVAIDGHETSASRSRCCNQCLEREVTVKTRGRNGNKRKVKEYYHRIVVAQWVGCTPPPILDIEMVLPKEGEVVAAKRLLARILREYPRLIDVITADAIYLEAPFIRMVADAGKHVIVVMKQEARDLYKDADRLRSLIKPRTVRAGAKTSVLWDIPHLSSFTTLGRESPSCLGRRGNRHQNRRAEVQAEANRRKDHQVNLDMGHYSRFFGAGNEDSAMGPRPLGPGKQGLQRTR